MIKIIKDRASRTVGISCSPEVLAVSAPLVQHPVSQEWPKRSDKESLLTASGMLLHAFPSMFVSSL
jgi:hypothetical protein